MWILASQELVTSQKPRRRLCQALRDSSQSLTVRAKMTSSLTRTPGVRRYILNPVISRAPGSETWRHYSQAAE